jgi:hypothetical protein
MAKHRLFQFAFIGINLFVINHVLLSLFKNNAQIFYISIALVVIITSVWISKNAKSEYVTAALFIVVFAFPEYTPASMHDGEPMNSITKFIPIIFAILMIKTRINIYSVIVILIFCVGVLQTSAEFSFTAISRELVISSIFMLSAVILSYNKKRCIGLNNHIPSIILLSQYLYIGLALAQPVLYALDLYVVTNGSYRFYFGHYIGILIVLSIWGVGENVTISGRRTTLMLLLVSSLFLLHNFQSLHFILITISLLWLSTRYRKIDVLVLFKLLTTILLLTASILVMYESFPPGSWMKLKLGQIISLFTFNFIGFSNSIMIRMLQGYEIVFNANVIEFLFGRGIGSSYRHTSTYWSYVNLHSSTYPLTELISGEFRYVHEAPILIFKWFGALGIFVLYLLTKNLNLPFKLMFFLIGTTSLGNTIWLLFIIMTLKKRIT